MLCMHICMCVYECMQVCRCMYECAPEIRYTEPRGLGLDFLKEVGAVLARPELTWATKTLS